MRIQYLNGGLANQTFQYIFYRFCELEHPEKGPWYLDDSFFYYKREHNGYELEKVFGVKPNLLSKEFNEEEWNTFINARKTNNTSIPQMLKNIGFNIIIISEDISVKDKNSFDGNIFQIKCNEYSPEIANLNYENIYYHGYWINKGWINKYKDLFLEELKIKEYDSDNNKNYSERINKEFSLGIHIRRGDFVNLGWNIKEDYYKESIVSLVGKEKESVLFIFSDDIKWCKDNYYQLGFDKAKEVVFVEGNNNGNNYYDLKLMTECKSLILSNSSFSYLAALLNNNLKYYINPVPYRQL